MLCIANKIYDAFRKHPVNCHAGNISLTYWTVFYGKLRKLYGNLILTFPLDLLLYNLLIKFGRRHARFKE